MSRTESFPRREVTGFHGENSNFSKTANFKIEAHAEDSTLAHSLLRQDVMDGSELQGSGEILLIKPLTKSPFGGVRIRSSRLLFKDGRIIIELQNKLHPKRCSQTVCRICL